MLTNDVHSQEFAQVRQWVAEARRITVLTGAGISTASGIPDFRGPNGIWTKNPLAEKASNIQTYLTDENVRIAGWKASSDRRLRTVEPNVGHLALVELERRGQLRGLATQNVDGLHLVAGNSPELVHEVHGTWQYTRCIGCGDRLPVEETLQRVDAGEADPKCLKCGGLMKRDVILFGEALVPEVINAALTAADEADLVLAIGTQLNVMPAANVVTSGKAAGAKVIIMNNQPTDRDRYADAFLMGDITAMLPALVAIPD
jgi:NAD-dependent deacetylase